MNDADRLAKLMAYPVNNLQEIAELLGQVEPENRRDPGEPVDRKAASSTGAILQSHVFNI